MIEHYQYHVVWSVEDQTYIANVAEFPLLAAHGDTAEKALHEIQFVVASVLEDMKKSGEAIPPPLHIVETKENMQISLPSYLREQLMVEARAKQIPLEQLIIANRRSFCNEKFYNNKNKNLCA